MQFLDSNERTSVQSKLAKKGIMMEDAKLFGFEEGISASLVSTVHGVETKGFIPLGFLFMGNDMMRNVCWSKCGTKVLYLLLGSLAHQAEMQFDSNDFSMSSQSAARDEVTGVCCYG